MTQCIIPNVLIKRLNSYDTDMNVFRDFLTNPDTGEIYQEGDTMFRPRLANTLEVIAEEGPNAFYGGSLTDSILAEIADSGMIRLLS
jgi:gamma-glutamyltranspeptidase